jgi:prepilin-type processing-associated H-X9-DG protein
MSRRRFGITLPELAAVVAVLAALAAVLTPALAGVRRHSKGTLCLQNLARIAQASIVYASQDHEQQAIPIHPVLADESATIMRIWISTLAYGGKSGRGRWDGNEWYWGTPLGRGPASRPLNRILYKRGFPNFAGPPYGDYQAGDILDRARGDWQLDLDVFRCPADDGYTGLHWIQWRSSGLSAYDFFGTSYYANALWVTDGSKIGANAAFLRPLSQVPNPAETIYYMEHCGKNAFWVEPTPDNDCESQGNRYDIIGGWHGEPFRFNAAFVDGHAQATLMRGYQSPALGHYPGFEDPAEGYEMYRCVIIRGPGWQLDTLPAPIIWPGIPDEDHRHRPDEEASDCLRLLAPDLDAVR